MATGGGKSRRKERLKSAIDRKMRDEMMKALGGLTWLDVERRRALRLLFSQDTSNSYDGRVIVVGAYEAGKTSLVMNLIGSNIPTTRQSTDGIDVYYGNLLYDLLKKRLIRAKTGEHHFPKSVYQKIEAYLELPKFTPSKEQQVRRSKISTKIPFDLRQLNEKIKVSDSREILQERHCIPIPILDFAGQVIYYVTHQTFITAHGIYVITFDGSRDLDSLLKGDLYCEAQMKIPTILDNIQLWISSILAYCSNTNEDYPKICFVATHKDMVDPADRDQRRKMLLNTISKTFPQENIRRHLKLDTLFFVNCFDKEDDEIMDLNEYLGRSLAKNPQWGAEVPAQFLLLEMMLAALVEEDKHILSRVEIEQMNQDSGAASLTSQQLDLFLDLQNMNGKLTYLNTAGLRDYVVINPTCLVDVLKSIVTAVPKVQELPNGYISKNTLTKIWARGGISKFKPYHEYLRELLVHLDVLAEAKRYDLKTGKQVNVDFYLVPSMITIKVPSSVHAKVLDNNKCRTFAFVFRGLHCPVALSNRLIACILSMWNIKEHNGKDMLFFGFVVVQIDRNHDLALQAEHNRIIISVIHKGQKELIVRDLASSIRETLQQNLNRISEVYSLYQEKGMSVEHFAPFDIHILSDCGECWIDSGNLHQDFVCKHGQTTLHSNMNIWFTDKEIPECLSSCKGLTDTVQSTMLTDVQLLRICNCLTRQKVKEVGLHLGLSDVKIRQIEENHGFSDMAYFYILRTCGERKKTCGDFMTAIQRVDENVHTMCKILREENVSTDIPDNILKMNPFDELIDGLCLRIGKEWQVLGLQLGLTTETLEQIQHDNPRVLTKVSRKMLLAWRNSERNPTIRDLVLAFRRVDRNPDLILEVFENCISSPNPSPSSSRNCTLM